MRRVGRSSGKGSCVLEGGVGGDDSGGSAVAGGAPIGGGAMGGGPSIGGTVGLGYEGGHGDTGRCVPGHDSFSGWRGELA